MKEQHTYKQKQKITRKERKKEKNKLKFILFQIS
jgi:hypothetical protein